MINKELIKIGNKVSILKNIPGIKFGTKGTIVSITHDCVVIEWDNDIKNGCQLHDKKVQDLFSDEELYLLNSL